MRLIGIIVLGLCGCTRAEPDAPASDGATATSPAPRTRAPAHVPGLPTLGGRRDRRVTLVEIANAGDGLATPRALAFHPTKSDELWIADYDDAVVVIDGAGTPQKTARHYHTDTSRHFLPKPSGIAFGGNGHFATIHEEDQPTQTSGTPGDFMGPTMWIANADFFDAGEATHVGMLHDSPDGMGIAWERDDRYWVFDGYHASITMYDFHGGHPPGGEDHSNGEVARYAEGQVQRVPGVPSHLALGPGGKLYVADTGNRRIAVLDTTSGTPGDKIDPNYDGDKQTMMVGAALTTLVDGAAIDVALPCGLALRDGVLYVGDNATGRVAAVSLDGKPLDWLELGLPPGALMGLAFDAAGRLHVADALGNRVLRVDP